MTQDEIYTEMMVIELQITDLKTRYHAFARKLDKCVIVRTQVKQKEWHGGCSAPAGDVRYWAPYLQRQHAQYRSHTTFSRDIREAKEMHRKQAENLLKELQKDDKYFRDTEFVTFQIVPVKDL